MHSKVLITGGGGYIGSHVAFYLYQKGYDVIIIDDFSTSPPSCPDWAETVQADYADELALSKIFTEHHIDCVMHFASFTQVAESVEKPFLYYQNNVAKTIELLRVMKKFDVEKIIFSSSCAVYGIPQTLPLKEDHPKNPISPYGTCKLMIENILEDYSKAYGLKYTSLRYFNAAGALPEFNLGEQHEPETHIIPLLFKFAREDRPFKIFGTDYDTKDGSCVRDYLNILDIAEAHLKSYLYLKDGNSSGCFNLGTGTGFSVKELIAAAEKVCNQNIQVIEAPRRAGDPATLVADYSKAKSILDWEPKYSDIEFTLNSAFLFHSRNLPLKEPFQEHSLF